MARFIREDGWRKSTKSAAENCVECATTASAVLVRDSKDPTGPVLRFDPERWTEFIAAVSDGTFAGPDPR
jgi:hypothetical protein